jgi:hypothetical protein
MVVLAAVLSAAAPLSATVASARDSGPPRTTLPPGLSAPEHRALTKAGAYGLRPVHVLLVGDSITLTLGIGLTAGSPDYGMTISNHATLGCDLDPSLAILDSGLPGRATQGCQLWRGLWPLLAAGAHAQVIALGVGRWEVLDHYYGGQWVHVGERVWDDHVVSDLKDAIAMFHASGARVVLFTMPYIDPADKQPDGLPWSEDVPARTKAFNADVWRVARTDPRGVDVIDLNRMLGPHGLYTASLDGVVVRWSDGIHVSQAGGELLRSQILPAFDRIGLADEAAAKARR